MVRGDDMGAKKPARKGNKGTATWVPALKNHKGKVKKQTKVRKKVL